MKHFLTMSLGLFTIGSFIAAGHAEASERGFGKSDIDRFCAKSGHQPVAGQQFDGRSADVEVMRLQPGKYSYPDQGALLLFPDGHYLLQLPRNRDGIHGTAGDDLLASGGIVGGCSKEQLSEAVQKNRLQPSSFERIKRYK